MDDATDESEDLQELETGRAELGKLAVTQRPSWVVCHERAVTSIGGAQLYER
jgi:hypothetical protein